MVTIVRQKIKIKHITRDLMLMIDGHIVHKMVCDLVFENGDKKCQVCQLITEKQFQFLKKNDYLIEEKVKKISEKLPERVTSNGI